mgnify:CR=1 FL=1
MAKWFVKRNGGDYEAIGRKFGIHPAVARLIRNRGIETDEEYEKYLNGGIECLHSPEKMKDLVRAANILSDKIKNGKKIRIVGDYDVDGVCSSAILMRGMTSFGAVVDTVIPHRIRDGYGINIRMIDEAIGEKVDTILTCDNGISAYDEVKRAVESGLTVLVTDHHEVPYEEKDGKRVYRVPEAHCVVDPKQEDCGYPFPGICGAEVAYKLITYMLDHKKELFTDKGIGIRFDTDSEEQFREEILQMAALATIGDIMELKDENRVIVKEGIRSMEQRPSVGLKALLDVQGLTGKHLNTYHFGFVLGPTINAAGRLDSAMRSYRLLIERDEAIARVQAEEIKQLNESRKSMTEDATELAVQSIEEGGFGNDRILVVYVPGCHESLAGIVAGKLRERYSRPAFVLTDAEVGLKGSARSIEAYHIYDAMTEIKDVFLKYGGHSQAAGFSIERDRLDEMRRRLNDNCRLEDQDFEEKLSLDAEMALCHISPDLVDQLEYLEPIGNGNESAIFACRNLRLVKGRLMGANGSFGRYTMEEEGQQYELLLFRQNDRLIKEIKDRYGDAVWEGILSGRENPDAAPVLLNVAYSVKWNEYKGNRNIQIVIEDFKLI